MIDSEISMASVLHGPQSPPSFTVRDAIESTGFGKFQFVLCAISGLSWLASAMEIMMLSVISPSLYCEWALNDVEQGLSTSVVFLGWMVSAPFWGRVCDVRGRREGLMIASFVGFIFGILCSLAPTFYLFLLARFGVGFAIGAMAQSVTLTSEFLPSANRARTLISFWAVGAALETAMAIILLPSLGWRWLVGLSAIPLALFGVCSWWLPESALFDISRGRVTEARATLVRIARFNGRSLPDGELISQPQAQNTSVFDLLRKGHRRTTIQLWIIWTLFGLLYIGLAIYISLLPYAPVNRCSTSESILNSTQYTVKNEVKNKPCRLLSTDNYVDIILTTMSEVPGFILVAFAIDLIGRRATFSVGFALFSICSAAMAFCLPRFLIVTALFVGRSSIGSVWQAGYIYTSEVYPTSLRAQGLGVASMWGRVGSMITPLITQKLASLNIVFPPIIYCIGGLVGVIVSVLLPIETRIVNMVSVIYLR